jgi:YYY domain-containing protein
MLSFLSWYLVVSLLGWLSFPLAYRLFPALTDRGYCLSRVLGLLVWGYLFWMLTSLGFIQNNASGLVLTLLALAALSAISLLRKNDGGREFDIRPLISWLKSNRRLILGVEILFFAAFAIWSFVRASNPEIVGTEKPMELAFINAVMRSPTFPPHDPWLSGYAISYYYFGYVITAMLAEVTGVLGSVAFNLMLALVFALSAVSAYGVLYNLLSVWKRKSAGRRTNPQSPPLTCTAPNAVRCRFRSGDASQSSIVNRKFAFLGPFFLLIVSNFEGFLEVLHRLGLFWDFKTGGLATSAFWKWLDIKDLSQPPVLPLGWIPERFWWWWRASRVVQDFSLTGTWNEIIDEFPFFSYLLGDLHPHVLAMPFDLLAIAVALNLFLGGWKGVTNLFGLRLHIDLPGFLFSALLLGGLAFLNTWDILFGFALIAGVYLLERVRQGGWNWNRLLEVVIFALPIGVLAILLYLPFYAGFSSQASGILPNLEYPTRGVHLWIFFGGLFLPVFAFLAYLWRGEKRPVRWMQAIGLAAGLVAALWAFSWLLAGLAQLRDPAFVKQYLGGEGGISAALFFSLATLRRFTYAGGLLTMLALIAAALALLLPAIRMETSREKDVTVAPGKDARLGEMSPVVFILFLTLIGSVLILAPEFVFLHDQFGNRMNTIFKFYYQAWLLLSLAAAFGVAALLQVLKGNRKTLYRFGLAVVLLMVLVYPLLSLPNKTTDFQIPDFNKSLDQARLAKDPSPLASAARVWSLDGGGLFYGPYPDDAAAVVWLRSAPDGVLVEATKPDASYSDYAHISTYSGLPTVLGWPMHEGQWRGGYEPQGTRQDDIARLYQTRNWEEAKAVLDQYNIRYVYVGTLERSTYRVYEAKFQSHLRQVFKQGDVVIYEVP